MTGLPLDIASLSKRAGDFYFEMDKYRDGVASRDFPWYPYCSLGSFEMLDRLLTGPYRNFFESIRGEAVLDIGCADGDLSFFLEASGFEVHAVDWPATNMNHMRGIKALRDVIGSRVEVSEIDLDAEPLPDRLYNTVFLLGVLYHLKNPFFALAHLAQRARYCFLSTRIARRTPKGAPMDGEPLAYLLASDELNEDDSNYWIFSEAALRRLLDRSGWEILELLAVSEGEGGSDPHSLANDERVYCFLASRRRLANIHLLDGWYAEEPGGWRWTAREFAFEIRPGRAAPQAIDLRILVPPRLLEHVGPITLHGRLGERFQPPTTYDAPGVHHVRCDLAGLWNGRSHLRAEFALDKALPPLGKDLRELGLVITEVRFAPSAP